MYDTVCQFGQGGCDRSGVRDSGMPSDAVRGCTVLLVQRDQMPSSVPASWGNEDNVARLILSDPDGPCPCEAFYSGKGQGAAHPGLCALSSRTPPAAAGAILSYQMVAGTPGTQLPHCSPGCTLCPVAPSCLAHLAGTICNKRGKGKKKKSDPCPICGVEPSSVTSPFRLAHSPGHSSTEEQSSVPSSYSCRPAPCPTHPSHRGTERRAGQDGPSDDTSPANEAPERRKRWGDGEPRSQGETARMHLI